MDSVTKKSVRIYVYGKCMAHLDKKPGNYAVKLEYKNKSKMICGFELHTTTNKIMIKGLVEAVKMLKEPCDITFYTPTKLGFSYIIKQGEYTKRTGKKANKEVLILLREALQKGGHSCKEVVSPDSKRLLQTYSNRKFINEYEKLINKQQSNHPVKTNKENDLSTEDGRIRYVKNNLKLPLNAFQENRVKEWDANRMLIAIDKYMRDGKDNFSYLQKCYKDSK